MLTAGVRNNFQHLLQRIAYTTAEGAPHYRHTLRY